MATVRPNTNWN